MRAIKIIIVLLTILVLSPIIAQETKPNQTSDNYDSHKEDPEPTSMLKKVKDILSRNYDNDTTGLHSMFGVTSLASFQEIPPGEVFRKKLSSSLEGQAQEYVIQNVEEKDSLIYFFVRVRQKIHAEEVSPPKAMVVAIDEHDGQLYVSKPGQLDSLLNSARKDFEEDGDENIVPFFSLSEKPQIDRSVNPEYPKAARKKKIGGRVVIMVLVDEEGNVEEAEIIKSPDQLLNEPTIEAVKQWKFSPGKQGDNPVKVWLKIPIDFSLKK